MIALTNGLIFRPDGTFQKGTVAAEGGVFVEPGELSPADTVIDAEGLYLIPGLTDIHFHGCAGHDFCEGTQTALQAIADYEASAGVTAICPATMTLPEEQLHKAVAAARDFSQQESATGAALVGVNLEGPFISPEKLGAQNPAYVQDPDIGMFRRLREASGGLVRLVTVAPELTGAMEFIEAASQDGVAVSLGHTTADYETAKRAFERGARHMTHLYNAMPPINHRSPGPILAAAETENVMAELICDGVHVHPAVVRHTLRTFDPDRVVFISDSMEATGMPDGNYELGGLPVQKTGNRAKLLDGTIAGSVTDLMGCLRTAVREMGVPLETAVRCAAVNPARAIGTDGLYGSIEPGKAACLAALNRDLELTMVLNRGRLDIKRKE